MIVPPIGGGTTTLDELTSSKHKNSGTVSLYLGYLSNDYATGHDQYAKNEERYTPADENPPTWPDKTSVTLIFVQFDEDDREYTKEDLEITTAKDAIAALLGIHVGDRERRAADGTVVW